MVRNYLFVTMGLICTRCKISKDFSQFQKRPSRKRGYHSWCRECASKKRYEEMKKNRLKAIEMIGGSCVKCNYSNYIGALHFHHPDPSIKDDMFHRLRNRSWDYIRDTLINQKCVLICANCHAEAHIMN